jgi:hypothetical protein
MSTMSKWFLCNNVPVFSCFLIFVDSISYQALERNPPAGSFARGNFGQFRGVVPATCRLWSDVNYCQDVKKKLGYLLHGPCCLEG